MQYSSIYNLDKEPIEVDQWTELKNGVSIDSRMTKQLVIKALEDAINHSGNVNGCILHSDRKSQYCSNDYTITLKGQRKPDLLLV